MTLLATKLARWSTTLAALCERLHAPAQLLARLFIAQVFFRLGLAKLADWETAAFAARAGIAAELVLPVLLVLGLGGRTAAAGLFVVNAVAMASMPEIPEVALQLHVLWGSVLAFLTLWGPGNWSVDRFIVPRFDAAAAYTRAAS